MPVSKPGTCIRKLLAVFWDVEPTSVVAPPTIQAIPAGMITILDLIFPLDPAATAAIMGIHMAMHPESLINALINTQTITTMTVKIRSFWKIFILLRDIPIFCATPV